MEGLAARFSGAEQEQFGSKRCLLWIQPPALLLAVQWPVQWLVSSQLIRVPWREELEYGYVDHFPFLGQKPGSDLA